MQIFQLKTIVNKLPEIRRSNKLNLVDPAGFEPATSSLQMRYSATELRAHLIVNIKYCGRTWTRTTDLTLIRGTL